jgi:RNA polymerase sigma factor (sigma-70 family)
MLMPSQLPEPSAEPQLACSFELSERALARLLTQNERPLRLYCRRFSLDGDDEDDLMQAVWVLAWERRCDYDGRGAFVGWLLRIARTICVREAKRRRAYVGVADIGEHAACASRDPLDAILRDELDDARITLVLSLPPRRRSVVLLRLIGGCSVNETASQLGLSPGTVKATLHQAINWLRVRASHPTAAGDQPSHGVDGEC